MIDNELRIVEGKPKSWDAAKKEAAAGATLNGTASNRTRQGVRRSEHVRTALLLSSAVRGAGEVRQRGQNWTDRVRGGDDGDAALPVPLYEAGDARGGLGYTEYTSEKRADEND